MRFLRPGLPQPPDDLEGGVGLAGAGGHDEQDAVLALGDGLDGGVDGVDLVVARRLAAAVVEVVLEDDLLGFGREALPGAIPRPELGRATGRRRGRGWSPSAALGAGAVVEDEAVAVGGEDEGDVERRRRSRGACCMPSPTLWLLSLASMSGDRDVGLVVEDVVGALGLAAGDQLAADDDPALGEADLLADLRHLVPARLLDGGRDELGADVAFGE